MATPTKLRICKNPLCATGLTYPGRYCRACYCYKYRHGHQRDPKTIHRGPAPKKISNLDTLWQQYLSGDSINQIAYKQTYSPDTLTRRFKEAGYKLRKNTDRHNKLTIGIVSQARRLAYDDGLAINKIAELLDENYMTMYDAVKGKTWKTTAGPYPQNKTATHKCTHCGLLCSQRSYSNETFAANVTLCRYCRQEKAAPNT